MPNTYTLIASTTLTSSQANITFSSIPQTYTDLVLSFSTRADQGDSNDSFDTIIKFNGSQNNIVHKSIRGDGSGVNYNSLTDRMLRTTVPSTYTASTFSNTNIYIAGYKTSNSKTFSVEAAVENNSASAGNIVIAGIWAQPDAITQIAINPNGNVAANFVAGSSAHLYGISNS